MVGAQSFARISEQQMEWLKNGGRNKIEQMARRFMRVWKKAGRRGYFYVSIDLPSDILVIAKRKNAVVSAVWKFDYDKMESAQKLYENIKEHYDDLETLMIINAKDDMGFENDLTIRIDATWQGTEACWYGWEYCQASIPIEIFPRGF